MTIKPRSAGRQLLIAVPLALILSLGLISSASAAPQKIPIWRNGTDQLAYGKAISASGESVWGLNLHWTSGGPTLHFGMQCETLSASGVVENSAYGKPGTLSNPKGTFKGCALTESPTKECTVPKEIPVTFQTTTLSNAVYSQGGMNLKGNLEFKTTCPEGYWPYTWKVSIDAQGYESGFVGEQIFPEETSKVTVSNAYPDATIEFDMGLQSATLKNEEGRISIGIHEIAEITYGHHWYTGGARYGEAPKTLVPAGTPLAITKGSASATFESTQVGLLMKINCSGSVEGSVENPVGGGDGTSNITYNFSSCAVVLPAGSGCTIEGGAIKTGALPGLISDPLAERPLLKFSPSSGTVIATFNLTGCTPAELNGLYKMTGSFYVYPQLNSGLLPGSWSIPISKNPKSGGPLRIRNQGASASGEVTAETSSGLLVTMG